MRLPTLALLIVLPALLAGQVRWAAPALGQALPIPVAPSRVGPSPAAPPTSATDPKAAAPAPLAPGSLAPAQAQQVLDLLRDDKRRAEFTATLEALVRAAPAVPRPGAVPADPAAPVPGQPGAAQPQRPPGGAAPIVAQVIPLAPDSLGAEVLDRASAGLADAGAQLVAAARSMNDLPLLWRWVATQAADPIARGRVLDTAWKLAAAVLAGFAGEWLTRRALRRFRATLGHWSPGPSEAEAGSPPVSHPVEFGLAAAEAGETERTERRQRLSRALGTLRRLPYLLGRLLLDLLPVAVFAGVGGLLAGTWLGQPATTGLVIRAVVSAYVLCRGVLAVAGFLVAPSAPRLRLLHVSDHAAAFLMCWTRRIAVTAVSTWTVTEVAVMFGLYNTARDALLKLFALLVHGLIVVAILQARAPVAARIRAIRARGIWAVLLNRLASVWHLVAVFYVVALWVIWAVELRNGYTRLVSFFLVTSGVLTGSRLLAVVLLGGLDRALRPSDALAARHPGLESRFNAYYPVLRLGVMAVLWTLTGVALLQAWGFGPLGWFTQGDLGSRVLSAALMIGVTALLAVLVWEGANAGIERHLAQLTAAAQLTRAGRLRTLMPMLRTSLLVVIVLVVALIVLSEVGVNIAPLLAGAGVVGIAVGFGSQKLVQDLITGLFLLLENAMQVGDVVTLGGLSGTVEALSIRTIRLRALDGAVHIIPFSAVTTVTNQTRDYGYAVLDISIGLNEEPDPVIAVVRAIAESMRTDPKWAPMILDALDVMGVERFIDTAWVLRVRLKTQPSSRWSVTRELNRRIKERFDELAIESPLTAYRSLSHTPPPPAQAPAQPQEQAA